jgi:site-specific DNA recombinase
MRCDVDIVGHFGSPVLILNHGTTVAALGKDRVRDALHHSHADEQREHEEATKRLRAEYDRLQNRIHAAYVDKLDGTIDAAFFEKMSEEWRAEQERCLRDIERHQDADQS